MNSILPELTKVRMRDIPYHENTPKEMVTDSRVIKITPAYTIWIYPGPHLEYVEIPPYCYINDLIINTKGECLRPLEITIGEESKVGHILVAGSSTITSLVIKGNCDQLRIDNAHTIMRLSFEGKYIAIPSNSLVLAAYDLEEAESETMIHPILDKYAQYSLQDWDLSDKAFRSFILSFTNTISKPRVHNPYKIFIEWIHRRRCPTRWYSKVLDIFREEEISAEHMAEVLQVMHDESIHQVSPLDDFTLD